MSSRSVLYRAIAATTLAVAVVPLAKNARAQGEARIAISGMAASPEFHLNAAAAPSPARMMHLTFAMQGIQRSAMEAFIASQHDPASPNYHHWLKPSEVGELFGAPAADVAAVVQYAESQHLTATVWPNGMFVSVAGTRSQVEDIFGVVLNGYDRPANTVTPGFATTFYAPDRNPSVPASIAVRVGAVLGLSSFPQLVPATSYGAVSRYHSSEASLLLNSATSLVDSLELGRLSNPSFTFPIDPVQVSKVYNFDGLHTLGLTGTGTTIGIFSPTEVNDSDIDFFCTTYGLGTPTIVHKLIDGGATDFDGQLEACLDAEVILGQAPNATIYYYQPPNDGDFDVWNQIVSDDRPVISDSWGYDESTLHAGGPDDDAYVGALDAIYAAMDLQGQAHFDATGDNGAHQGVKGALSVTYPASSTHVTAVGGTSLFGDSNGNYQSESGWSDGGGGLSIYFDRPVWQTGPGVTNSSSNGRRQIPDVSSLADPSTPGFIIRAEGQWFQAGGTSAAAPLWSVADQLYDQQLSQLGDKPTGLLNTDLYGLGNAYSTQPGTFCFHDVVSGNNGFYSCTSGWDFVTGWGSADFTRLMYDYLENYRGLGYADLLPFTPSGVTSDGTFKSPIMISTSPTTIAEPATFDTTHTYYFFVCAENNGLADSLPAKNSLQIDGVNNSFVMGPFGAGQFYVARLSISQKLTPGPHTIKLVVNSDGKINESNTANNTFSRSITVPGFYLSSATVTPSSIAGGQEAMVSVYMSQQVPSPGVTINVSSSNTALVSVPATITVPAGLKIWSFRATASPVLTATPVTITVGTGSDAVTATLEIQPSSPARLAIAPAILSSGQNAAGILQLNGTAPAGGIVIPLSSSNTHALVVPASVTIPAGASSVVFAVHALSVANNSAATVSCTANGVTRQTSLIVTALPK